MLAAMFTLSAVARDFTYNGLNYTVLDEGTKTCETKSGTIYEPGNLEASGEVTIPSVAKDGDADYKVVAVGEYSFARAMGLVSVTLPNSVTEIGEYAFSDCAALTEIGISDSVRAIGDYAFMSCMLLSDVSIPNSVISIGEAAFAGCGGLTVISIPASVDSIGLDAFLGCTGLAEINVDSSNKKYASAGGVLFDKGLIRLVRYPAGKTEAAYSIPQSVKVLEEEAFSYSASLSSVAIPNSVTVIGSNAFRDCSALNSIDIPSSVETIGSYAFTSCNGLVSVSIPGSVTEIGDNPFFSCENITGISVDSSNTKYVSVDGVLYDKDVSHLIAYPIGRTDKSYSIPATVGKPRRG